MEQDALVTLDAPLQAPVLFTMDNEARPPELLLPIFDEYRKTPLYLHIVWRTKSPPATSQLALFKGRKIRQFWDPNGKTPSTGGRLRIQDKWIEMERLALRMGLAHAAIQPH